MIAVGTSGRYWQLGGGDRFGKLLTFDDKMVYGVQTFYTFLKHDPSMHPDTHTGHLHQKYARYTADQFPIGTRLFAQDNIKPANGQPVKKRRRTLKDHTHKWNQKTLVQFRAMVLTGDVLFAAGWKDAVKIFEKDPYAPNEPVLTAISTVDGRALKEYRLEAEPVFDGMAAARNKLYLAQKDGTVICLGRK